MLNRFLLVALVLTLSCLTFGQQNLNQEAGGVPAPNTATCAATFTSGTGHNLTSFCVTVNGNIVQFSRGGDEYIQVGAIIEGYGICDRTSLIRYFDWADRDSGNWLAASFSSTSTKAISTRVSSDGIWQIKNTITKKPANAMGPGSATVQMQIKNLTGANREIFLFRDADVDFLRGATADVINDFFYTGDTVANVERGFKTGLSLTNNTFTFDDLAFARDSVPPPDPCGTSSAPQPFFGDGSVATFHHITVPKLSTKTVTVTYKPI